MISSFVCGIIFIIIQGVDSLVLNSYTACYGSTGLDNFLQPKCLSGEKMAVVGLFAIAKPNATLCPISVTPTNQDSVPDSCCQYDTADCVTRYDTSVYRSYYQQCNGNTQCTIQVSWINTPCSHSIYIDRTNYMKFDYYCISDQGLDPCSSINTIDNQVFLWNSGYPSSPLTGSSSCTCSVEASCNTNIRVTAIDLRLGSSTSCGQSIEIDDGGTVTTFDCSSNNDYLPSLLYTSTSHFIQIQLKDNQGTAGGYYFLLIEGSAEGSDLTLSCSSTAITIPSIPSVDLDACPNSFFTRASTIDESTIDYKYTSDISKSPGTMSTFTPNLETGYSKTIFTTESESKMTSSSAESKQTTSKDQETSGTDVSPDTVPTFVSLPSTSIEKDVTATSLSTLSFQATDKNNDYSSETSHEMITSLMANVTDDSSNASAQPTTTPSPGIETDTSESKSSNNSIIIGTIIVAIIVVALIIAFIWYKDKIKECCFKSKANSRNKDDEDEMYPFYDTIFDGNLNIYNRSKPHQLPPLQHHGVIRNTFEHKRKSNKIGNQDTMLGNVDTTNQNVKKKSKKKKQRKQKQSKDVIKSIPTFTPSHTKSTFPGSVFNMLGDSNSSKRRPSVIDITGADGHLESSVELNNNPQMFNLKS